MPDTPQARPTPLPSALFERAALEVLARINSSHAPDAHALNALRSVFSRNCSVRLALGDAPHGFVTLTSDLLALGPLTFSLYSAQHGVGQAIFSGRPHLVAPGAAATDRIRQSFHDLSGATSNNSGSSMFICLPILPAGGGLPAMGSLILQLASVDHIIQEDLRACLLLSSELSLRHCDALVRAAGRVALVLAPLGLVGPRSGRGGGGGSSSGQRGLQRNSGGSSDSLLLDGSDAAGANEEEEEQDGNGNGWGGDVARPRELLVVGAAPRLHTWGLEGFRQCWNGRRVATDRKLMALCLALFIVSVARNRSFFRQPFSLAFAVIYSTALAGSLHWCLAAPRSYAVWREPMSAVLAAMAFYAPFTWEVSRKALADVSIWQRGPVLGTLGFWMAVVFATMLPMLVLGGIWQPKRLTLQWATQAVLAAAVLREVPTICDSPLLQQPASQAQLGCVHAALRTAAGALGPGLPPGNGDVPAPAQCCAVLSTLVLMIGYLLPMIVAGMAERREYRQFVLARLAQAGLVPQRPPLRVPLGQRHVAGNSAPQQRCTAWLLAKHASVYVVLRVGVLLLSLAVWRVCIAAYSDRP